MDKQWKDQDVTVVRDAKPGDPGYVGDHQVIVRLEDGTEKTVSRLDVTDRVNPPLEETEIVRSAEPEPETLRWPKR